MVRISGALPSAKIAGANDCCNDGTVCTTPSSPPASVGCWPLSDFAASRIPKGRRRGRKGGGWQCQSKQILLGVRDFNAAAPAPRSESKTADQHHRECDAAVSSTSAPPISARQTIAQPRRTKSVPSEASATSNGTAVVPYLTSAWVACSVVFESSQLWNPIANRLLVLRRQA